MIDLLLRLLDNVKQLIELRNKRADTTFAKLIEETFNDLQLVHQDYMETMGQLIELLPSKDEKPVAYQRNIIGALTFLKARSAKLEPIRDKLRGYQAVQETRRDPVTKSNDVDRFLNEVLGYLYWSVPDVAAYTSVYRTWIAELEERAKPESEQKHFIRVRGELRSDAINQREEMRMHWSAVSRVYAEIKVKVVSR